LIKPDVASNTEAILAFYGKMKELAETLGMTNTEVDLAVISGAAGVRSTAADLCKLLAYAFNTSAKVKSIWGKSSYTISVTGSNPRSWDIASNTTARAKSMIEGFEGGKSGSSDKMGAYAFCWKDENGEAYATALCEMTLATGDMIKDAKYIADEACSLI
jgi:D-alanyl-D-alanine carboxypeptidase